MLCEQDQQRLEHELDFVTGQQQELEEALRPLEQVCLNLSPYVAISVSIYLSYLSVSLSVCLSHFLSISLSLFPSYSFYLSI